MHKEHSGGSLVFFNYNSLITPDGCVTTQEIILFIIQFLCEQYVGL